jgi:deoxyribodipyrimidine photo-lyase
MLGRRRRNVKELYNVGAPSCTRFRKGSNDLRLNATPGWKTAIVWFRRDLRVEDHPALLEVCTRAGRVLPLFVLDDRLLAWSAPARAWFLRRSLAELDASLRARGSGLLIRRGRPEVVVPQVAAEFGADVVVATRDVTPLSYRRDRAIARALEREGRRLALRPGLLLVEPESLVTTNGTPYGVFTPFWRALQGAPRREVVSSPGHVPTPADALLGSTSPMAELAGLAPPLEGLPSPGEAAASERLSGWVTGGLADYAGDRDALSGSGTSRLGVDLHFGTLSPLQIESAALESGVDATSFVRQLAWREFYHHLLFHRRATWDELESPLRAAFRSEDEDREAVSAWRDGRTGIPAVDAAMRQLLATAWLSNRARLVVASFLTRHLLMDYRIGERHFMRHLIDGDVANNRGGWQWTAGVGADPQPWFRIFNPVRQGSRFDPDGSWVRRWVPELEYVPDRYIHAPWEMPADVAATAGVRLGTTYPRPIVDLAAGRERALAAFRAASEASGS